MEGKLTSLVLKAGDTVRIGRSMACEVTVRCPNVSSVHCRVALTPAMPAPSASRCSITDQSTNGTWLLRSAVAGSTARRLSKGMEEELQRGDVFLLLAPSHDLSNQFRFTIEVTKEEEEEEGGERGSSAGTQYVLRQLQDTDITAVASPSSSNLQKTSSPFTKRTRTEAESDAERLKHPRLEDPKDGIITSLPFSPSSPTSTSERCPTCLALLPSEDLPAHSDACQRKNKTNSQPSEPEPDNKLTMADRTSPILLLSASPPPPPPPPPLLPVLAMREVSMELCPNCSGLFPLDELITHVEECGGLGDSEASSSVIDCDESRPITSAIDSDSVPARLLVKSNASVEQCPNCLELFPVLGLISHHSTCVGKEFSFGSARPSVSGSDVLGSGEKGLHICTPLDDEISPEFVTGVDGKEGGVKSREVSSREVVALAEDDLEQCVHCLRDFPISELPAHASTCSKRDMEKCDVEEHCQHCLQVLPLDELVTHSLNCSHRKDRGDLEEELEGGVLGSQEEWGEPIERCMHCFKDFPLSMIVEHSYKCMGDMSGTRERFREFLPSVHDLDAMALTVLSDTQMAAVEYVIRRSKEESERLLPHLQSRVAALGYTEKDLDRTLQWVRQEAPIIIHLNLDRVLGFLVKDTHYRNQFETRTSGGSTDLRARSSWEDRIFNGIYAHSNPVDRVKYGVLNIVGDPRGVRSCVHYGDSFLQLKKVRLRTTFASADTSCGSVKLSCCEYYCNVMNEYSDPELRAIMEVSTRKKSFLRSDIISIYKEIQIHGPVCLSENVECIVVNNRHAGCTATRELLDKFVERNNCNLIWMEPEAETTYPTIDGAATMVSSGVVSGGCGLSGAAYTDPSESRRRRKRESRRRRRRRRRREEEAYVWPRALDGRRDHYYHDDEEDYCSDDSYDY